MEEKRKTYKEKVDADKMLDEMHKLISGIEMVKAQVVERAPGLKEYVGAIPNAGTFAYNKMNEFVKKLAEKSIDDESVIYSVLKNKLSSLVIDNVNDMLGYDVTTWSEEKRALENSEDKGLIEVKKPTIWQRIKRFINRKVFNIYMTDEDIESLNKFLERRDEARRKVRDNVIERANKIYKIELNEEFISQAISNYTGMIISQRDGNIEVFKQEIEEELEKLDMQDLVKIVDEKKREEESFRQSIKFKVDNGVKSEPRVANKEATEKGNLAHGGAR